jgi:hypothetical protein
MYKATIKVIDKDTTPNHPKVIKQYEIEYTDADDLMTHYEAARKVWDEYFVEADTQYMVMTSSHTYKEEFLTAFEQDQLQWEYMNGEYED